MISSCVISSLSSLLLLLLVMLLVMLSMTSCCVLGLALVVNSAWPNTQTLLWRLDYRWSLGGVHKLRNQDWKWLLVSLDIEIHLFPFRHIRDLNWLIFTPALPTDQILSLSRVPQCLPDCLAKLLFLTTCMATSSVPLTRHMWPCL